MRSAGSRSRLAASASFRTSASKSHASEAWPHTLESSQSWAHLNTDLREDGDEEPVYIFKAAPRHRRASEVSPNPYSNPSSRRSAMLQAQRRKEASSTSLPPAELMVSLDSDGLQSIEVVTSPQQRQLRQRQSHRRRMRSLELVRAKADPMGDRARRRD